MSATAVRRPIPLANKVFASFMAAAACGVAALWLTRAPIGQLSLPGAVLPAVFATLTALAVLFPLHFSTAHKLLLSDGVMFAALLLFGAPTAMLVIALGASVGYLLLTALGRRTVWDILFNPGKAALAVGLAGGAYHLAGSGRVPVSIDGLEDILPVALAALTIFVANSFPTQIAIWLQIKRNPFKGWLAAHRVDAPQTVALYLLGLVAAISAAQHAWTALAVVLPAIPIYVSLQRTVRFLERRLDEQTITAIEAMADTVDMRDRSTFEHSKRVAEYAVRLALALELPAVEVEAVRLAARVHDLGKIGIADHILHKPDALTDAERAQIDRHAEIGYDILCRFADYHYCKELVRLHHHRWDQRNLLEDIGADGEQRLLSAQIISVADGLDAMTSDRPYHKAMPVEQAMAEFRRERGRQWHPGVVDAVGTLFPAPEPAAALNLGGFRGLSAATA